MASDTGLMVSIPDIVVSTIEVRVAGETSKKTAAITDRSFQDGVSLLLITLDLSDLSSLASPP